MAYAPFADVSRKCGGLVRFKAMARALDRMGIRYTLSAKGEPLVQQDELDGKPQQAKTRGPRWDMIGSVRNLRP